MDDGRKVVFAISGFYYERELVDYYLTWRSKSVCVVLVMLYPFRRGN